MLLSELLDSAVDGAQNVEGLGLEVAAVEYDAQLEEKRKLDPQAVDVRHHETAFLKERIKRAQFGFDFLRQALGDLSLINQPNDLHYGHHSTTY